jgi:hypothetical protein
MLPSLTFLFVLPRLPTCRRENAEAEQGMAFFSGSGGLMNDQLVRAYQAEVARRAAASGHNLPFLPPGSQDEPPSLLTVSGSHPIVPPSDGDTRGPSSSDDGAAFAGEGAFLAEATIVPGAAPFIIRPTIYRDDTVTVEDPVLINIRGAEFRDFITRMDRLIETIQQSNETAQETRQQMLAELKAGAEYIKAAKPSRKVLTLLLVVPLTAATTIAASTMVQEAAKLALKALLKLISPDVDIPV